MHSRPGTTAGDRAAYVDALCRAVEQSDIAGLKTVYFGGGTPALCELEPLLEALAPRLGEDAEFTVELNPRDVKDSLLASLKKGGVNRISMGVQSLDDGVLADMGRGYGFFEAERAFYLIKEYFDNAGIDLIVGYPGETAALTPRHARLAKWGLKHCSVYSLIMEEDSALGRRYRAPAAERGENVPLPDDDTVMNRLAVISSFLAELGLERYEISNYSVPGFECRHNLAVWRGEEYLGLGEGACGRVGLMRTRNQWSLTPPFEERKEPAPATAPEEVEEVSPEYDRKERAPFRLRTKEGLAADGFPHWKGALEKFAAEGLLKRENRTYILTSRGMEVCDSILEELI